MKIVQVIVLAIVQGITEFLPVSSSGHLVVVSQLLRWPEQPLVFDTTLHLATAATLVVFFFEDLKKLVAAFFVDIFNKREKIGEYSKDAKLFWYILLCSIPAGILGFLFQDTFDRVFRAEKWVILFLILGSLLMATAQSAGKKAALNHKAGLDAPKSLLLGIFQSLALFPGVSRSGSTISGALFLGFDRKEAARISFLMSIPVVALAGIYKLISTNWANAGVSFASLGIGFVVSFVVGLFAVKFFLNYLAKKDLNVFIYYRIFFAVFLVLLLI